jgi:hypothetical protein
MVAINQFLGRVMPLNLTILRDFTVYMLLDFTVFRTFFPQCEQLLHLNFVHINQIQNKVKGYDQIDNLREEKLSHGISNI